MVNDPLWREIAGFPGYDVSSDGRTRSWRNCGRGWATNLPSPTETKGYTDKLGYRRVMMRKIGDTKPYSRPVHRLVAFAFIGEPPSPQHTDVAHLDGNPLNNHVSNLAWATHAENQGMMVAHVSAAYGEKAYGSKLTAVQVAEIRETVRVGPRGTQRRMMEKFGVGAPQINRIVKGTRWPHLP